MKKRDIENIQMHHYQDTKSEQNGTRQMWLVLCVFDETLQRWKTPTYDLLILKKTEPRHDMLTLEEENIILMERSFAFMVALMVY